MFAELLHDTHFWVLLSTLLFAVVAISKGSAPLLALLDARTARIKAALEEAERLRAQAEDMLADARRQNRDAAQTAQKIVESARVTAAGLTAEAERRLEETLARRETQLVERIARAEQTAVAELKAEAATLASRAAEKLLQDALPQTGAKILDDAIRALPSRAH